MALSLEEYRRALEQADRQRMDTGYRLNTPGYNEYATAATRELFPGANSMLALSGIPLLSDAAGLAADIEMFQGNPETRGPVNYGLSGLGLLPFVPNVAASLRGVRDGRKYYHGVSSATDGTLSSKDSILRDGFARGASSEEHIPGTSISYDPAVSGNLFGRGNADNVLGVDLGVPASEVWNLPPDLYMAGYRAGDGQAVSKPNIPNQEAELFGTRPELAASEIQRFAPRAKAGPIDAYKDMPTEDLMYQLDDIKDELEDYKNIPSLSGDKGPAWAYKQELAKKANLSSPGSIDFHVDNIDGIDEYIDLYRKKLAQDPGDAYLAGQLNKFETLKEGIPEYLRIKNSSGPSAFDKLSEMASKFGVDNKTVEFWSTRPEYVDKELEKAKGYLSTHPNNPDVVNTYNDWKSIKENLAEYDQIKAAGAGLSRGKREVSAEERELMDERAAINAIIKARKSGQLKEPTAPFTPRELNSTENQYVQRQIDHVNNTNENLTNLFFGDNPTRKDVRDTVEGLSNVRGNRAYFDRMMTSTGNLLNEALDPFSGSSQVAKALIEAVGPKNVDQIAAAASDYKSKMTKASEMTKPRLQAENTSLDDLMLRTKGDIRNEGNPQARQAVREAVKARNELFDLMYHSTFSK